MTIDHIEAFVDCNPVANIIIPPASIRKLVGYKNYLRQHLWPLLEGLVGSPDVQQFCNVLPATKHGVENKFCLPLQEFRQ